MMDAKIVIIFGINPSLMACVMENVLALMAGSACDACNTQLAGASTHASSRKRMSAKRWRKSFMPVREMSMSRPLLARRKEVVTRGTCTLARIDIMHIACNQIFMRWMCREFSFTQNNRFCVHCCVIVLCSSRCELMLAKMAVIRMQRGNHANKLFIFFGQYHTPQKHTYAA